MVVDSRVVVIMILRFVIHNVHKNLEWKSTMENNFTHIDDEVVVKAKTIRLAPAGLTFRFLIVMLWIHHHCHYHNVDKLIISVAMTLTSSIAPKQSNDVWRQRWLKHSDSTVVYNIDINIYI